MTVVLDCKKSIHCNCLSVSDSGRYLAVSDVTCGVHIYQLTKQKVFVSCCIAAVDVVSLYTLYTQCIKSESVNSMCNRYRQGSDFIQ